LQNFIYFEDGSMNSGVEVHL